MRGATVKKIIGKTYEPACGLKIARLLGPLRSIIGGFNQSQGEAIFWSGKNYRMMTFCYNDQTSTKTARTAAVFRHKLAWLLHVCLISLERFLQALHTFNLLLKLSKPFCFFF